MKGINTLKKENAWYKQDDKALKLLKEKDYKGFEDYILYGNKEHSEMYEENKQD